MKSAILSLLAGVAFFAIPTLGQADSNALCSKVPPPACLYTCIQQVGECHVCTTARASSSLGDCISRTCPPKDISYARVYKSCICPNGGFLDYNTDPPHFEVVPPKSCSTA